MADKPVRLASGLYIVATPIGNLQDITARALTVLAGANVIAAEDTRHSEKLLQHYHISTPLIAYHDHSHATAQARIFERLEQGQAVALISDAGTPLISDPGYRLVAEARAQDYAVYPIPGPCALIAVLSAAGLPTDRFSFEGFLPAKSAARKAQLASVAALPHTLVFYEAPHRIEASLADLAAELGQERQAVLAREVSKTFETFLSGSLAEISAKVSADSNQRRGEMVIAVTGYQKKNEQELKPETQKIMRSMQAELPLKKAAALTAQITGEKKNKLYQWALEQGSEKET